MARRRSPCKPHSRISRTKAMCRWGRSEMPVWFFRASKPDIGADAYLGYYVGLNVPKCAVGIWFASNSWHPITNVPMRLSANTFYHLKIQTLGSRIRIFVTDTNQPVLDLQDGTFAGEWLACAITAATATNQFPVSQILTRRNS